MLESGRITVTLSGKILKVFTTGGRLQGGMLTCLLWSLVVDGFLRKLNEEGYYATGYADNSAILINGKFPQTVSEVLHTAQGLVE